MQRKTQHRPHHYVYACTLCMCLRRAWKCVCMLAWLIYTCVPTWLFWRLNLFSLFLCLVEGYLVAIFNYTIILYLLCINVALFTLILFDFHATWFNGYIASFCDLIACFNLLYNAPMLLEISAILCRILVFLRGLYVAIICLALWCLFGQILQVIFLHFLCWN